MTNEWTGFQASLLAVINALALFGNISLFVVILRTYALRTQTNLFLLNLAAADLLVSVLNMPLTIATILHGSWMFGEFLCTLTAFFEVGWINFIEEAELKLLAVRDERDYS